MTDNDKILFINLSSKIKGFGDFKNVNNDTR